MKQIYLLRGVVLLLAFLPKLSFSQCTTCSPGQSVDSVVQEVTLSGILQFNTPITFNQFSPATGILSCVRATAVVTTTVEMQLVNRNYTNRETFAMVYTRVTTLTGPGINRTSSNTINYGPYDLGQAGVDPDSSVALGPDVIFNTRVLQQTLSSGTSPYVGAGTVSFNYFNNGSWLMTQGNDNYGLDVAANSFVNIRLVYYFCPLIVLSSNMRDVELKHANKKVNVSWFTDNENEGNSYVVEYSSNGRDFSEAGRLTSLGEGNKKYVFTHEPAIPAQKLFYRVKQFTADQKTYISPVQKITLQEEWTTAPSVYPNPATDKISISFPKAQSGTVVAELINLTGQVMQASTFRASGTSTYTINLDRGLPPGAYWLRVRNLYTGIASTNRVFIGR